MAAKKKEKPVKTQEKPVKTQEKPLTNAVTEARKRKQELFMA